MAELNEIYRRAKYYDVAFARDIGREVQFIRDLHQRRTGRTLASLLEIACGPGYHARAFARLGVKTWGLDLRPEMIDYARELAAADGVEVGWSASDMRSFTLPQPVDVIATLYDSLDCLLTNDEIIDHFRRVGANLTPGGCYLVEMTHPRDCSPWNYGSHQYAGERDGMEVVIQWAVNGGPRVDPMRQVVEVETALRVKENGTEQIFYDRAKERFCNPQEYGLIAEASGALRLVETYGDFDLGQPFDNSPSARRMILIFEPVP
jgi:SAM-dependent methyltransferase